MWVGVKKHYLELHGLALSKLVLDKIERDFTVPVVDLEVCNPFPSEKRTGHRSMESNAKLRISSQNKVEKCILPQFTVRVEHTSPQK